MDQRTLAAVLAAPLLVVLVVLAFAVPLPYAVYSPGPTFDVLGKDADEAEIIQVDGHKVYRDEGQIRFTTVRTTARGDDLSLGDLVGAWLDEDRAVYPYEIAHPEDQTAEEEEIEGQVSMISSQDNAVAVALTELGYDVTSGVGVARVDPDGAASKELRLRDIFVSVDGEKVRTADDVIKAVSRHGPGDPVDLVMLRDGKRFETSIEPKEVEGEPKIGVSLATGYKFPFKVTIRVDETIGGPSAGLMFSLAVYDTLTPGSLTGDGVIAGTGEIYSDGTVGAIGGIEQKIAAAEDVDAELFFVPPDNCEDVADLDPDLRLVKAETMHDARLALEDWVDDHDADLPSC